MRDRYFTHRPIYTSTPWIVSQICRVYIHRATGRLRLAAATRRLSRAALRSCAGAGDGVGLGVMRAPETPASARPERRQARPQQTNACRNSESVLGFPKMEIPKPSHARPALRDAALGGLRRTTMRSARAAREGAVETISQRLRTARNQKAVKALKTNDPAKSLISHPNDFKGLHPPSRNLSFRMTKRAFRLRAPLPNAASKACDGRAAPRRRGRDLESPLAKKLRKEALKSMKSLSRVILCAGAREIAAAPCARTSRAPSPRAAPLALVPMNTGPVAAPMRVGAK